MFQKECPVGRNLIGTEKPKLLRHCDPMSTHDIVAETEDADFDWRGQLLDKAVSASVPVSARVDAYRLHDSLAFVLFSLREKSLLVVFSSLAK